MCLTRQGSDCESRHLVSTFESSCRSFASVGVINASVSDVKRLHLRNGRHASWCTCSSALKTKTVNWVLNEIENTCANFQCCWLWPLGHKSHLGADCCSPIKIRLPTLALLPMMLILEIWQYPTLPPSVGGPTSKVGICWWIRLPIDETAT